MANFDLSALTLGDVSVTGKGAKSCPFYSHGGIAAATPEAMPLCYEPSAYNDDQATRVNIVFRPPQTVLDSITELDQWIIQAATKDSVKFFGKQKSEEQIRESYQPLVRQNARSTRLRLRPSSTSPALQRCACGTGTRKPVSNRRSGEAVR